MRAILATLVLCLFVSAARAETASYYGFESGRRTASGERFDPNAMTAAHRTLPFGTLVRVTYRGRSVVVRINDRGPFLQKRGHFTRDIDLSQGAARRIGLPGVGQVTIEVINKTELYIPKHGDWGVF
jgi:peptidoglycan lytic transglycosylase